MRHTGKGLAGRGLFALVVGLAASGAGCGGKAAGAAVPDPCRLLGQAAASRIVGYHPAVLSNGVVRYLKLQDDGRICIYGPAPMQARQAGSWQLSLLVDREQLPGGATRAPGEKRFVVGRTIVDWLWVSSDQSGTMSFSEKGMSYWVLVGRKGGTEPRAESLARQAVNVVLAGTQ